MTSIQSPTTPADAVRTRHSRETTTSRVMMATGAVMLGTSAAIDFLGGPLIQLGRLGLDAIALEDPLLGAGLVMLAVGAVIGRWAKRRRITPRPDL